MNSAVPPKDDEPDPNVKVLKASFSLKNRVGSGGIEAANIEAAEKRLREAKMLFPQVAAADLQVIELAIDKLQKDVDVATELENIHTSALELKSNGAMFQFPLVTAVAQSLADFLEEMPGLTPMGRNVIMVHLKTLHVALAQGPRAVTPNDEAELLFGLKKAREKALSQSE